MALVEALQKKLMSYTLQDLVSVNFSQFSSVWGILLSC